MRDSPPRRSTGGRPLRGCLPKPDRRGTDQEAMDVAGRFRGGAVCRGERVMQSLSGLHSFKSILPQSKSSLCDSSVHLDFHCSGLPAPAPPVAR